MPPDEDEITRPGTPDSLRTMHDLEAAVARIHVRLNAMCDALDRIEKAVPDAKRVALSAKSESTRALQSASHAEQASRFTDKRVDSLVARVQKVESGQR